MLNLILKLSTATRYDYSNTYGDTNKYFLIKNLTAEEFKLLKNSSNSNYGYAIVDSSSSFGYGTSKEVMSIFFPAYLKKHPEAKIIHETNENIISILDRKILEGNVEILLKLDSSIPQKTINVA